MNNFPAIGINPSELLRAVETLLREAAESDEKFGAVNWGDLGVVDVEYRLSMLDIHATPYFVVMIEEASRVQTQRVAQATPG